MDEPKEGNKSDGFMYGKRVDRDEATKVWLVVTRSYKLVHLIRKKKPFYCLRLKLLTFGFNFQV